MLKREPVCLYNEKICELNIMQFFIPHGGLKRTDASVRLERSDEWNTRLAEEAALRCRFQV